MLIVKTGKRLQLDITTKPCEIEKMRYLKFVWLLLLFLVVSCSGNRIAKDIPGGQGGIVRTETEEEIHDVFRFIVGPGDEIAVKVWRNDDLNRDVRVDPSGNISLPLVGKVKASGLTISQLREEVTLRLSKYFVDPQVDINVSNLKSQKVYVLGEVKSPGTFDWQANMPAWEVISKAGGFTLDANEENVLLVRSEDGKTVVRALNIRNMFKEGKLSRGTYLRNGDLIYVLPTVIASVERFMERFYNIINPFTALERGIILYPEVEDILRGKERKGGIIVTP